LKQVFEVAQHPMSADLRPPAADPTACAAPQVDHVEQVEQAAQRLAAGALVAFPTETVYGLGARADDDAAVAAIFAAKGRPADHPLIVHLARASMAAEFAQAPNEDARKLMAAFWPGPLTLIVQRKPGCGQAAAGGQDSIGLRVPSHPLALALLARAAELGVPGVAGPSANRFGRVSPTTAAHVRQELGARLLVLDGGPCQVGIESTIIDCTRDQPALLRPGQLSIQQLQSVLGKALVAAGADAPRAPGTLASHYAPGARLHLLATEALRLRLKEAAQSAEPEIIGVYSRTAFAEETLALRQGPVAKRTEHAALPVTHPTAPRWPFVFKRMPADADEAAHVLFAALRDFDLAGSTQIWVEAPPPDARWDGVRDRLQRAAA